MVKILIPTAKELNTKTSSYKLAEVSGLTKLIACEMAKKDNAELMKIYKIKEDKASLEYERWQNLKNNTALGYKALHLFNGLMYRNIKRDNLTKKEQQYIENNVFLTSSLYGVINVLEIIAEHRFDFLQKVKIADKSLKKLWQESYDNFVKDEELVISLLSSEFEEVFSKKYRDNFVKITFMEEKNGDLKIHSTISKKARGKFLSELVKNNVTKFAQLKEIAFDNFKYSESLSEDKNLVFIAK